VSELFSKFSNFTNTRLRKNHQAIEDKKRDRLLRACWIIYYREVYLGENLTDDWKQNFARKSTVYSSIDVWWERKIESEGGEIKDASGRTRKLKLSRNKTIGGEVAELTFPNYPVLEDSGNIFLPKRKKIKFVRR
jgi:hypothetical protein